VGEVGGGVGGKLEIDVGGRAGAGAGEETGGEIGGEIGKEGGGKLLVMERAVEKNNR
jgi:hypothetical protein